MNQVNLESINKAETSERAKILTKAHYFEWVVGEILKEHFFITKELPLGNGRHSDFTTSNGINIEVKYTNQPSLLSFAHYIRNFIAHHSIAELDKTIFVANVIKDDINLPNTIIQHNGKILLILTLENLLYLCKDDEEMRQQLTKCLSISTENLTPQPLDKNLEQLLSGCRKKTKQKVKTEPSLEDILKGIPEGKNNFGDYEKFCEKLVTTVFQDNLEDPITQKINNQALYRFDLVSALKENPCSFWKFIYDKFNSCFILFECKNYSDKITQNEIYTTERYLYNNALRNVAIVFSRKGMDKNANIACQSILKEHGKLILVLNDDEVIKLINTYFEKLDDDTKISPSDILFQKAKDFLLNLDK